MGSSCCDQMSPKQLDTKYSSSLRTPSFSSSSSSLPSSFGSSYYKNDSPLSPVTPVRYSGVPFSWERLPGIPKMLQSHKKKDSIKLLPLPPPTSKEASFNRKKSSSSTSTSTAVAESFRKDPFFTALVEFSESIVYLPRRSSRTGTAKYGLINRRSR
ncbi:hypothetical protein GOBAR_AA09819 [Gossypium barbadense]|uniref:Uncharacterized protein n=1 Tax=Gossypium barbadense TaxID=3634 RepID=A0A2P5Y5J0_GOSBA|nr:hypothetical protein GOBAR_AA09819 [Gossypium barbadense]